MIRDRRVLAIIPARGGSKGVPRKNLRLLGGRPLLEWTAIAVAGSRYVDRAILSTDDDEIARVGRQLGLEVPFLRPPHAATDESTADEVIAHALKALGDEAFYLAYLEPTSPFRAPADIDAAIELLDSSSAAACVSISESPSPPEWMYYLGPNSKIEPLLNGAIPGRRQESRTCYVLNGAVYVSRVDDYLVKRSFLTETTIAYVMPRERGWDLDGPEDFLSAESMLAAGFVGG